MFLTFTTRPAAAEHTCVGRCIRNKTLLTKMVRFWGLSIGGVSQRGRTFFACELSVRPSMAALGIRRVKAHELVHVWILGKGARTIAP